MPLTDLRALRRQVDEGRLEPLYVFVGEDVKLVDRMVAAVEGTVDEADRPFAVERVYAGEPGGSPVEVVSAARVLPMLGTRRIVIVLRAERWLKPKRNVRAAAADDGGRESGADEPIDLTVVEEYVAAPVASTTLVFAATEADRSRRLTKRLLERACVVEFAGLPAERGGPVRRDGRSPAAEWLQAELVRAGKAIDADAARLLASRAGQDITKLRGDVERLLLFTEGRRRISADDVAEVIAEDETVTDDWAVVNAIAGGQAAAAILEAARRLERGDSPHALVGQLRWWVGARLAEGDPARVRGALEALLRTDLALKSSGGDDRVLIERLVAELTGRPLPQRGWGGRR